MKGLAVSISAKNSGAVQIEDTDWTITMITSFAMAISR